MFISGTLLVRSVSQHPGPHGEEADACVARTSGDFQLQLAQIVNLGLCNDVPRRKSDYRAAATVGISGRREEPRPEEDRGSPQWRLACRKKVHTNRKD